MDEERREHVQKMKKMEAEMEQVFEMKVKEKMQKLKDSENDVSNGSSIDIRDAPTIGRQLLLADYPPFCR